MVLAFFELAKQSHRSARIALLATRLPRKARAGTVADETHTDDEWFPLGSRVDYLTKNYQGKFMTSLRPS